MDPPRLVLSGVRRWPGGPPEDIAVVAGTISTCGSIRSDDQLSQFDGALLLPGFVNIHAHLDKAGLAARVANVSGTVDEARWRMKAAKAGFTRADVQERALQVARSSVTNGVTAIRTHVDIDPVVGLTSVEALLALREQMLGVLELQIVAFPQEGIVEAPGTEDLMREALRMGVDCVGGHLSILQSPEAMRVALDSVFGLAREFDRDIDVHTDFGIDFEPRVSRHGDGRLYPDGLGIVHLAERTVSEGFQGRVAASHVCGLSSVPADLRANVIDLIASAAVSVIACPASNLVAHGRSDATGPRRGIAPVRELLDGGVRVALGTDNIRDPFDPFLGTHPVINAVLAAISCHMVNESDFATVIELQTSQPAAIMRLPDYGISDGCSADIVVLEARDLTELLDGRFSPLLVLKNGQEVAAATVVRTYFPDVAGPDYASA